MAEKMKILLAASEVVPFAKTGGLADVAGALPKALTALGHDVRVILPKYKAVDDKKFSLKTVIEKMDVPVGEMLYACKVKSSVIPNTSIPVYFIEENSFFNRDELYRTKAGDFPDNLERFTLYSRGVLELVKRLNWQPDVIHCNDWQTALIPTYIKTLYWTDPFYKDIATIFTIHNLAYQGVFHRESLRVTGLGWDVFTPDKLEFWGQINLMKAGLVYSDILNTVSQQYSKEIQTGDEYGRGLEGVLKYRSNDLFGIVNGIDYEEWSPSVDTVLAPNHYSASSISKKAVIKKMLTEKVGLPFQEKVPVLGLISRLDDQKGLDLIAAITKDLMKLDLQLVILGTGEQKYHDLFTQLKKDYPAKAGVTLGFFNDLAHFIYGGSDFFLMPSRFEPCGLGQLISLSYGTIPIVRKTGGLADTITEFNPKTGKGNGFVFSEYDPKALLATVQRGLAVYKNASQWTSLVKAAMQNDFSWKVSAQKYADLYQKAINKRRHPQAAPKHDK